MKKREEHRLIGKDEMNLCEYPLALISRKSSPDIKTINYSETGPSPTGELVKRKWLVTGSDAFGLPLPHDNGVLLALLYLCKKQGLNSPVIHFSRYELCDIMNLKPGGKTYKDIKKSLERLSGVIVETENTFWDNKKKEYATILFGIIDEFRLYNETEEGMSESHSYIRFGDTFFQSIMSGFIKSIDLDTFFSLKNPVARQLYRYLDKKRYNRKIFQIGLNLLCYGHLGFVRDVHMYASKLKRSLDSAHEELTNIDFIKSAEYEKMADNKTEKVVYTFTEATIKTLPDTNPLITKMVELGVTQSVAEQITKEYPEDDINIQIKVLPYRKAENPPAVLICAIQDDWKLPAAFIKAETERMRTKKAKARVKAEEKAKKAYRERIISYIQNLTKTETKTLTEKARALALKEGDKLFRNGEIPDHILEGYKHIIVEKLFADNNTGGVKIAVGIGIN